MLRAVRGLIVVCSSSAWSRRRCRTSRLLPSGPWCKSSPTQATAETSAGYGICRARWSPARTACSVVGGPGPVRGASGDLGGLTVADSADVLRQRLGRREGRTGASGGHPATRPRPPPVAVPGLLHQVAHWRADTACDGRIRWCATPSDRLPLPAAHRRSRADRGDRLSAGHLVADDRRRAGPHTAGLDHAEVRRSRRPGGDATGDERGPRDGR